MSELNLKPTHAAVKNYHAALHQFGQLHIDHEMVVRSAFQYLLSSSGRKLKLTLVPEFEIKRKHSSIRVDGALLDDFHLAHGYWEAKDEKDDLDREIKSKLEKGYPRDNIIFQAPERAVLYQSGARVADEDISKPDNLVQVVNQFFDYKAPHIEEWEQAVSEFSERIPELAAAVKKIIDEERRHSPAFVRSFDDFYALCRQAINPNLSEDAVERMLIQHLLTERIFERIFDNPDFTRRNVVAAEIEKVIVELTKRAFNRNGFLRPLDRFYKAIEVSAENTTGFTEKQAFLNKVYERFFQGYSPKEADTHGIVYTPQPIVNFMVRSVEEILQKEFGRSLGDKGVHILDPFVGTGNFIVNIMDRIKATDLPYKYQNELHCNEVMLLPYYIASMNIEHAYFERTGEYSAFPGICLVDTFELAESRQSPLFTEENTQRVERQKEQKIFVVIANPPYNMGQLDESDNNQNREYPALEEKVAATYTAQSSATLRNKLSDPYVKAFRWASDRIGDEGIVCFVSNNSFLDNIAFDGMRSCLESEFSNVYHLNLKGNAHTSGERRRREAGNIFDDQIRVGVGITLLVKNRKKPPPAEISVYSVDDCLPSEKKRDLLVNAVEFSQIPLQRVTPDRRHTWLTEGEREDFVSFIAAASRVEKGSAHPDESTIFKLYSLGVVTNRDTYAYSFDRVTLEGNVRRMIAAYNSALALAVQSPAENVALLIDPNDNRTKWTRQNKAALSSRKSTPAFRADAVRVSLYRPFTKAFLYFEDFWNEEQYKMRNIFPTAATESENLVIVASTIGYRSGYTAIASAQIPELHFGSSTDGFQCFPFYTYAEDGSNRRENIADWALEQFRSHYHDASITKWDIFHYIYAVLHHPEYRERYAANLRRELPRIPFASAATLNNCHPERSEGSAALSGAEKMQIPRSARDDKSKKVSANSASSAVKDLDVFRALVKSGQRLAEIHVRYEQQPEYPLTKREKAGEKLDWRVTKMRLSKDKTSLVYNQFLTLSEIPKETYDYRLGNRSALEWVIDQYQVSTDKRSGIANDPNRDDDPQYIVRLIGQVITVSLETVGIVSALPPLGLAPRGEGPIGGPSA
ncbi:MAG TPA: type ISP restriction/modification enzyme [Terriglobales bacterium]|nr:type ISP restriction/modification enzyme [Terriglobales bacterium]HXP81180.1 type ISP restriction/modification enzyme [Verrucomicrobiae bacterium]